MRNAGSAVVVLPPDFCGPVTWTGNLDVPNAFQVARFHISEQKSKGSTGYITPAAGYDGTTSEKEKVEATDDSLVMSTTYGKIRISD